jgi:hypothetical protein
MCNAVIDGKRAYATPAELSKLVGAENLIWQDHNPFSRWPEGKEWRLMDIPAAILVKGGVGLRARRRSHGMVHRPIDTSRKFP